VVDSKLLIHVNICSKVQELSDAWVKKHGIVETGSAAWTLPGKMKNCKFIIHAVGPVWSNVIIDF
jgi:O-acetyl-ADP-ribose deacetylase (regulator of RNase III)